MPNGPLGSGVTTATSPTHDLAGRAVDRDDVAFVHDDVADRERPRLQVDACTASAPQIAGVPMPRATTAAWLDEPAARGEDALGRDHAVQVVGRGLGAHEDDALALRVVRFGVVGREVHATDGRARRRVQALREHRVLRLGVELRVQHLVELIGLHAQHRLVLRDQALFVHLDGHAQRGERRCACRRASAA